MPKTVMVVDDAATVRQVARSAITSAGYQVIEACNGKDALLKLKDNRISLLITDLNMPEMDGITLIRRLKSHDAFRFLPVVCLTAENKESFIPKAKEAGACAWIDKPFSPADIIAIVKRLVR